MPNVSVVIPSLDSPLIDRTIASLRAQTAADRIAEILVVGYDRLGLVAEDGLVRLIPTGPGLCAAANRNRGVCEARGEWLAFIDADCVADTGWLAALLAHLEQRPAAVVGGAVEFPADNYWTLADNLTQLHEFLPDAPPADRPYLASIGLLLHQTTFAAVGRFDEALPRGEDIDWMWRARQLGHPIHFEPAARLMHLPPRGTCAEMLQRNWASGYFMRRVRMRHGYRTAALLQRPLLLQALAPLIASLAAARIFWYNPALVRYITTLPAILLAKVAWCLGAALAAYHKR